MIKLYIGIHAKNPLFLSYFKEILNFLDGFSTNTQIINLMKIRPVGAEMLHADRRPDIHDNANSRISQFCEMHLKVNWQV